MTPLLDLPPVPALLARVRRELSADFPAGTPIRVARAPGRLDVMGGIADYTGSLVCEMPLDRAAAVAITGRADRTIQVFSFNLFDEHKPFTLRIELDALASASAESLRRDFDSPGRRWAAYLVGCLFMLHAERLIDLADPQAKGLNLALLSDVPIGAGVSSSAAIEVATMMGLVDWFGVKSLDPMRVAVLCQMAENRIAGAPCGVMDQATSCGGEAGALFRLVCQPHEVQPTLAIPSGVKFVGIDSGVRHDVGGGPYARTRCAAFMARALILDRMRDLGAAAGQVLTGDPMRGYLANLDQEDYKRIFRPHLPESLRGMDYVAKHTDAIDPVAPVDPAVDYFVRGAADHHVMEARRARDFAKHLEAAAAADNPIDRGGGLDRAGHLMYASHRSYGMKAKLGAPECDLLVDLARKQEPAGLYGARITGGGCGGTIAVLADADHRAAEAIQAVLIDYERQTGRKPQLFDGSSPGAWHVGTAEVR